MEELPPATYPLILLNHLFLKCVSLEELQSERQKRQRGAIFWFIPPNDHNIWGQARQNSGASSGSPTWGAESHIPKSFSAAFTGVSRELDKECGSQVGCQGCRQQPSRPHRSASPIFFCKMHLFIFRSIFVKIPNISFNIIIYFLMLGQSTSHMGMPVQVPTALLLIQLPPVELWKAAADGPKSCGPATHV